MKHHNFRLLLGACAGISAMLLAGGASADDTALPAVQYAGDLSFIGGGIGSDESDAIKTESGTYALVITFTNRIAGRNAYTTDVQLNIATIDGASVLDIPSAGPLLLVDLPAGKYRVTATSDGFSKTQLVQVSAGGHRRMAFEWTGAEQA